MKLKNAVHRSFVIIVILLMSIAVGYVYSLLGHRADLNNHPREYTEYVEKYAAEYGIPEYIVYADLLGENSESGILYDPETNVKYGTYYLSYLYTEYSRWENVFAAYLTSTDEYTAWISDKANTDTSGNLIKIPDKAVSDKIDKIEGSAELYKELYY